VAGVLVAAVPQAGCDLHLALLSIEESGSAEYTENYGSRRGRWSEEDEFEAGEVDDRHAVLSEWRRPDGSSSVLGELPIEKWAPNGATSCGLHDAISASCCLFATSRINYGDADCCS
jgi:hypothetical protein